MEFTQLVLPGMPVRIILSCIWEGADRPATIRATLDAPSDQFTSQMEGYDLEGRFTPEELGDALATLALELVAKLK